MWKILDIQRVGLDVLKAILEFVFDRRGNAALMTSLLAAPLFAAIGIALDYAILEYNRSALQEAADSAVLATAKELGMANSKDEELKVIASNYFFSNLGGIGNPEVTDTDVVIGTDRGDVEIMVSHYWKPFLMQYFGKNVLPIRVSATAKLAGEGTICMIGLDTNKKKTIHLVKKASLEAPGCGVYSNSKHKEAIKVEDNASLIAGVTCSAGGVKGAKKASFEPEPMTDCPIIEDPLAGRSMPMVRHCNYFGFKVDRGKHTLYPGTYCKGLKVHKNAVVFLKPGIYVIKGGKLEVTDNAVFEGKNVGFFLAGNKAKLIFKKNTTINLTAPKKGVMAGMLVFESRYASRIEKHQITSDNARLLLGTIYLPNGTLKIDSEGPISDKSAYTAIIARTIELAEGPTLHLNSDYEATDVPVPEGLVNDSVYLSK